MGENCQKPGRSVTNTGNSSTPKTQMKPCNGCGLGVFQGRRITTGPSWTWRASYIAVRTLPDLRSIVSLSSVSGQGTDLFRYS
ncbi:hypothetical protein BXU04_04790 [Xanthomonas oryzae pv. oryzae]|nr:hypothetical protein BXU04_04790 [Xanthomonas oryzae pv. oryzae]